jgi:Helix-turn-helix domain
VAAIPGLGGGLHDRDCDVLAGEQDRPGVVAQPEVVEAGRRGHPPVFDCGVNVRTKTVVKSVVNRSLDDLNPAAKPAKCLINGVEAIGTYSNLGHLCKKWVDLRRRINESQRRPRQLSQDVPKPRSKRFLTAQDVADIVHRYEADETTQQIGNRYGISKTRVATVLREQGVTIRRQGLSDEQVREAATLYVAGKSLASLGVRFGVSHTTIAAILRQQGVELRPRPGWN